MLTSELFLIILSFTSFSLLAYKSYQKNELAILGVAITRLYLCILLIVKYFYGTYPMYHSLILTAIGLMLITDITTSSFRLVIEHKRKQLYEEKLQHVNQKFLATVDTSPISFFTIDTTGIIEYLNDSLAQLLGTTKEQLLGRNLIHILDPHCKQDLLVELKEKGQANCLIKTNGGYQKALILGKETQNGHLTITGSVYIQ